MVGSVACISESHAATVLRLNTSCPICVNGSMLHGKSVGLAACKMGTKRTITAEDSVPTLGSDELSVIILFHMEPLA